MTMFSDMRTEWRLNDIESKLRDKAESHELTSLHHNMDRLESTLREACSKIDQLCCEVESATQVMNQQAQKIDDLENMIENL